MPTYVYVVIRDDGSEGEQFEVVQRMSEEALTRHPVSGLPVRRVITRPIVPGQGSDHHTKHLLSNKKLNEMGFTKYERAGDGHYEKKAGKGPNVISSD